MSIHKVEPHCQGCNKVIRHPEQLYDCTGVGGSKWLCRECAPAKYVRNQDNKKVVPEHYRNGPIF